MSWWNGKKDKDEKRAAGASVDDFFGRHEHGLDPKNQGKQPAHTWHSSNKWADMAPDVSNVFDW
jgi:hypothetical protein